MCTHFLSFAGFFAVFEILKGFLLENYILIWTRFGNVTACQIFFVMFAFVLMSIVDEKKVYITTITLFL